MKTVKEWCEYIYSWAKRKGWWDIIKSPLELHMLMVSELAEATEESRKGTEPVYYENGKPEGELIELADCVIRIMDYCGYKGWDLEEAVETKMKYNETRPYRHGNKKF